MLHKCYLIALSLLPMCLYPTNHSTSKDHSQYDLILDDEWLENNFKLIPKEALLTECEIKSELLMRILIDNFFPDLRKCGIDPRNKLFKIGKFNLNDTTQCITITADEIDQHPYIIENDWFVELEDCKFIVTESASELFKPINNMKIIKYTYLYISLLWVIRPKAMDIYYGID